MTTMRPRTANGMTRLRARSHRGVILPDPSRRSRIPNQRSSNHRPAARPPPVTWLALLGDMTSRTRRGLEIRSALRWFAEHGFAAPYVGRLGPRTHERARTRTECGPAPGVTPRAPG